MPTPPVTTAERSTSWAPLVILAASVAVFGCSNAKDDEASPAPAQVQAQAQSQKPGAPGVADDEINPRLLRRFQPIEPTPPGAKALVDLGRQLYFEPRLSKTGTMSCNSCHALDQYGVDNEKVSRGVAGMLGGRNSPTVYNAAGHFTQFWDGRAADVEAQAKVPILNPTEMAMPSESAVVGTLAKIPGYVGAFAAAFPESKEPLSYDNVGIAIGAFERGLMTPGRWDRFLRGEHDALTADERRGLRSFLNAGCMVCHTGPFLGGSMFERVGVVEPWPNQADEGRFTVTHVTADKMTFKVPSLRNVEKTAPYFHDGSATTLREAVVRMGRHQLGLELSVEESESIVTWLKSLTGPLPPAEYIRKPTLPGNF